MGKKCKQLPGIKIVIAVYVFLLILPVYAETAYREEPELVDMGRNSPFGIHAPYTEVSYLTQLDETGFLTDVGIKWARILEIELDDLAKQLSENNINILSGIARARYPFDMQKHLERVRATVRQYKNYVKAWLIVNEADVSWKDGLERYVEFFKLTSEAVKSEAPDSVIVLSVAGGQASPEATERSLRFFDYILKNGLWQYFDVLDFHFQGAADDYKDLAIKTNAFRGIFKINGIKEKPIWITEYGTHDGDPTPDHQWQPDFPYQTEQQQAAGLVKKYVYGISLGIKKMFWTTMFEWFNFNNNLNSYFSNVGLVNNPATDGLSHNKLAYYTYKLMVDKLETSDWDTVESLANLPENVHTYKFIKKDTGKQIWVAW